MKAKNAAATGFFLNFRFLRADQGSKSWVVDLGEIDGKRERHSFRTKEEAETFAEQARIKKQNEGLAAFNLPPEVRADALRASELLAPSGLSIHQAVADLVKANEVLTGTGISMHQALTEYANAFEKLKRVNAGLTQAAAEYGKALEVLNPHNVSLLQAVEHYQNHVLRFKNAPSIKDIVEKMIAAAETNNRRDRTVGDIRYRLRAFAEDFGDRKLTELTIEEVEDWIDEDGWEARTRINYLTKISQLFNYAIRNGWAEHNLAERIDRPEVEDNEAKIFTVEQAKQILDQSINFGLRPYIAIGLFAGLRSAELLRLKGDAIKNDEKVIVVGADVAKKRSRRVVEMCDALLHWLKDLLPINGHIVDAAKFRENMDELKKACGIEEWPHNALRHSFGSYHLAFYGDQVKTANQMGHRDAAVVHNHYKALVLKSEAEKYWGISL